MKNANTAFIVTPARITIVRFHTGWRSDARARATRPPRLTTGAAPRPARRAAPRTLRLEPRRDRPRARAERVLPGENQPHRHFVGGIERSGCRPTHRGRGAAEPVRRVQLRLDRLERE